MSNELYYTAEEVPPTATLQERVDTLEKIVTAQASELERMQQLLMDLEPVRREQKEKERVEKERLEKERLEKERVEKERLEKERLEKERFVMKEESKCSILPSSSFIFCHNHHFLAGSTNSRLYVSLQ